MLVLYVKGCFKRKRLQQYCLCVPKRGVCNDDTCSDVPVAQTCKQNAAFFSTDPFKAKIYIFSYQDQFLCANLLLNCKQI